METLISLKKFNHKNILIKYDLNKILQQDVDLFVSSIISMIENGEKFLSGETFQVGWSVLIFYEIDLETLSLKELNMSGISGEFSEEITNTLGYLRKQKDTLASVDSCAELKFPSMRQAAIACTKFFDVSDYFISRSEIDGNDSGWFFGCSSNEHDHNDPKNLYSESIYSLSCKRLNLIKYLAFPEDYMIAFKNNNPENIFNSNGEVLSIKSGSYLDRIKSNHVDGPHMDDCRSRIKWPRNNQE